MNKRLIILGACLLAVSGCKQLQPNAPKYVNEAQKPTVRLTLIPQEPIKPGQPVTVLAKLNLIEERSLLADEDLLPNASGKVGLLIIDPMLSDYQYVEPQLTGTRGIYSFRFTPRVTGYHVWADIIPSSTGKQLFAMGELGNPRGVGMDRTVRMESDVGSGHYTLNFDRSPMEGKDSVGSIHVRGAAPDSVVRIVGVYEDRRSVVNATNVVYKNGEISFALKPVKPGVLRLFAQVKLGGRDIFVPFTFGVEKYKF